MLSRYFASIAALCLTGCAATVHQTAPTQQVVPIFAVDYAALSADAASACERRAPGTGERIRAAHERWQGQHHAAQQRSLQLVDEQTQLETSQRGQPVTPLSLRQERWRAQSLQGLRD